MWPVRNFESCVLWVVSTDILANVSTDYWPMHGPTIDQYISRKLVDTLDDSQSTDRLTIHWDLITASTDRGSICGLLNVDEVSVISCQVLVIYLSSVGVSADDSQWLPIHRLVCVKHMKQTLILTSLTDYLTLEDFLFHKKINFIHDLWLRSCKTTSQSIFTWDLGIGRLNGVVTFSLYSCIFDPHLPPSMTALYRFYSWQSFLRFWYATLAYISGVILKGEITSSSVLNA